MDIRIFAEDRPNIRTQLGSGFVALVATVVHMAARDERSQQGQQSKEGSRLRLQLGK